jgi:phosphate-selective porin
MSIRMITRALPILLTGAMLAAPAFAQTAAPAATPAPAPAPVTAAPGKASAAVERRITELHSKLKITPAEQASFDGFANVMRANAEHMDVMVARRQETNGTASAVEQMQIYGDMAQAHAEDMHKLVPAFASLYNSLTPAQQKLADQSFRQMPRPPRSHG